MAEKTGARISLKGTVLVTQMQTVRESLNAEKKTTALDGNLNQPINVVINQNQIVWMLPNGKIIVVMDVNGIYQEQINAIYIKILME